MSDHICECRERTAQLEQLMALPDMSATVADIIDDLGAGFTVSASLLTPLRPGQKVCGPAITLRYQHTTDDHRGAHRPTSETGLGDTTRSTPAPNPATSPSSTAPTPTLLLSAPSPRDGLNWPVFPP